MKAPASRTGVQPGWNGFMRVRLGGTTMSVALFIVVVAVSFIVVRIGAIAFQLTGLHWSQAKFQALSCFTGTGFTTRESELIVGHSQRRRIASILMVLGNAGLVLLIATFANSLRPNRIIENLLRRLMPDWIPVVLVPLLNLLILALGFYVVLKIFGSVHVSDRISSVLRRTLLRKHILDSLSIEEPVMTARREGILRIVLGERNPWIGRHVSEAANESIRILALESDGEITLDPAADVQLDLGDSLLCFGPLAEMRGRLLRGK